MQVFLLILEFNEKLWQGNPKLRMCTGQKLDHRLVPMLLQLLQLLLSPGARAAEPGSKHRVHLRAIRPSSQKITGQHLEWKDFQTPDVLGKERNL